MIPNGVDVERFRPRPPDAALRKEFGLGRAPVVGIVAALRPEKNHALFLRAAGECCVRCPTPASLIVGDGPQRGELEALAGACRIAAAVRFLGTRSDVPEVLSLVDVLALTSHMEANPVSILEAMAAEKPVVATRVGSVDKAVQDGRTRLPGSAGQRRRTGRPVDRTAAGPLAGGGLRPRRTADVLEHASVERMVAGYEELFEGIYQQKAATPREEAVFPRGKAIRRGLGWRSRHARIVVAHVSRQPAWRPTSVRA